MACCQFKFLRVNKNSMAAKRAMHVSRVEPRARHFMVRVHAWQDTLANFRVFGDCLRLRSSDCGEKSGRREPHAQFRLELRSLSVSLLNRGLSRRAADIVR